MVRRKQKKKKQDLIKRVRQQFPVGRIVPLDNCGIGSCVKEYYDGILEDGRFIELAKGVHVYLVKLPGNEIVITHHGENKPVLVCQDIYNPTSSDKEVLVYHMYGREKLNSDWFATDLVEVFENGINRLTQGEPDYFHNEVSLAKNLEDYLLENSSQLILFREFKELEDYQTKRASFSSFLPRVTLVQSIARLKEDLCWRLGKKEDYPKFIEMNESQIMEEIEQYWLETHHRTFYSTLPKMWVGVVDGHFLCTTYATKHKLPIDETGPIMRFWATDKNYAKDKYGLNEDTIDHLMWASLEEIYKKQGESALLIPKAGGQDGNDKIFKDRGYKLRRGYDKGNPVAYFVKRLNTKS